MSGSESQQRKVELMCAHKNSMIIVSILWSLQIPLQNNLITLIHVLVNGLYKITTESIKLILDVEQFDMSSNLIIPTLDVQKCHFSFFYVSSLSHFHRNASY